MKKLKGIMANRLTKVEAKLTWPKKRSVSFQEGESFIIYNSDPLEPSELVYQNPKSEAEEKSKEKLSNPGKKSGLTKSQIKKGKEKAEKRTSKISVDKEISSAKKAEIIRSKQKALREEKLSEKRKASKQDIKGGAKQNQKDSQNVKDKSLKSTSLKKDLSENKSSLKDKTKDKKDQHKELSSERSKKREERRKRLQEREQLKSLLDSFNKRLAGNPKASGKKHKKILKAPKEVKSYWYEPSELQALAQEAENKINNEDKRKLKTFNGNKRKPSSYEKFLMKKKRPVKWVHPEDLKKLKLQKLAKKMAKDQHDFEASDNKEKLAFAVKQDQKLRSHKESQIDLATNTQHDDHTNDKDNDYDRYNEVLEEYQIFRARQEQKLARQQREQEEEEKQQAALKEREERNRLRLERETKARKRLCESYAKHLLAKAEQERKYKKEREQMERDEEEKKQKKNQKPIEKSEAQKEEEAVLEKIILKSEIEDEEPLPNLSDYRIRKRIYHPFPFDI